MGIFTYFSGWKWKMISNHHLAIIILSLVFVGDIPVTLPPQRVDVGFGPYWPFRFSSDSYFLMLFKTCISFHFSFLGVPWFSGWWFQPISKIWVKLGIFPNFWGENKQYLKPPPSFKKGRKLWYFNSWNYGIKFSAVESSILRGDLFELNRSGN